MLRIGCGSQQITHTIRNRQWYCGLVSLRVCGGGTRIVRSGNTEAVLNSLLTQLLTRSAMFDWCKALHFGALMSRRMVILRVGVG
jgi:hypothetical protein